MKDGYITFDPDQTKARNARKILLPPELFAKLEAIKGKLWFWENYSADLHQIRKASGEQHKVHRRFQPSSLYSFVIRLFKKYNQAHDDKIHSHDFRRRAAMRSFEEGHSLDEVALMFGLERQTAANYYIAWQKMSTDKQFKTMGPKLLPVASV